MSVSYFPNKYKGKCVSCGTKVNPDCGICFKSMGGGYSCGCRYCFPAESASVYADRDAKLDKAIKDMEQLKEKQIALIAERKALIEKLGLKLDSPFDVKTTQGAWNDISEWKVSFTGSGSDEEFRKAIATPSESLYGQLRASGGQCLDEVNRESKYVRISESVMLCD